MNRNDQWDELFAGFASDVSKMSRAVRLKVGAVAVRDCRVIAIGFNGTPKGEDNCCEDKVYYDNHDPYHNPNDFPESEELNPSRNDGMVKRYKLVTKSNVVHAEDNLIQFAKEHSIDLNGCTLYITHSPCYQCTKKILDNGFKEVVYKMLFRETAHLSDFNHAVKVRQWKQ